LKLQRIRTHPSSLLDSCSHAALQSEKLTRKPPIGSTTDSQAQPANPYIKSKRNKTLKHLLCECCWTTWIETSSNRPDFRASRFTRASLGCCLSVVRLPRGGWCSYFRRLSSSPFFPNCSPRKWCRSGNDLKDNGIFINEHEWALRQGSFAKMYLVCCGQDLSSFGHCCLQVICCVLLCRSQSSAVKASMHSTKNTLTDLSKVWKAIFLLSFYPTYFFQLFIYDLLIASMNTVCDFATRQPSFVYLTSGQVLIFVHFSLSCKVAAF
jgi:hypothetical protein